VIDRFVSDNRHGIDPAEYLLQSFWSLKAISLAPALELGCRQHELPVGNAP
jgi:hypothetical protein